MPGSVAKVRLEADILKCFRAGILAIDLSGNMLYVNEIGSKILAGSAVGVGNSLKAHVGDNAFYRFLMESLDLKYLPSRVELELPGGDGSPRSIGFTLAELNEDDRRVGICAV